MRDVVTFVLAGGHGNRLYPLTRGQAKPAISFGGSLCLLDLTLLNCLRSGVEEAILLVQYQTATLVERVRSGWSAVEDRGRFTVYFRPPLPTSSPYRGTADAVWRNLDCLSGAGDSDVLILAGDHVYDMDYRELVDYHRASAADLTIGVSPVPVEEARRFGVLACSRGGRVTAFREKPQRNLFAGGSELGPEFALRGRAEWVRASMGIYVFRADVLRQVLREGPGADNGTDFGREVIPAMIDRFRVFAFEFLDERGRPAYWRDVGTVKAYYDAQMDLLETPPSFRPRIPAALPPSRLTDVVWDPRTRVLASASSVLTGEVRSSVVSRGAAVEEGARVENAVLLEGSVVERDAKVVQAVVGQGARVLRGTTVAGEYWSSPQPAVGRIYRTFTGIAVVPAGEVVAPASVSPYRRGSFLGVRDLGGRTVRAPFLGLGS